MRRPSGIIVVDASILISSCLTRSAGAITRVVGKVALATSERAVEEAERRMELGMKRPELLSILAAALEEIDVVATDDETVLSQAELSLQDAVSSRNGSTRDAHLIALAWALDADIWSTDRDFAGTGVASWSTPNLVRALSEH